MEQSIRLSARNAETQELVAVHWQNLTPDIASIDGNVLTGLQNGQAIVSADGNAAPLFIRVIQNFGGWYPGQRSDGEAEIGSAYAIECTSPNLLWCEFNVLEERLGKGPEPFAMHLVQTQDSVAGFAYIRCGNAAVTGSVDGGGQLRLRGAFGLKGPPTCPIEEWSTRLADNGRALQGRFKYSSVVSPGTLVTFELRGVPRRPEANPR